MMSINDGGYWATVAASQQVSNARTMDKSVAVDNANTSLSKTCSSHVTLNEPETAPSITESAFDENPSVAENESCPKAVSSDSQVQSVQENRSPEKTCLVGVPVVDDFQENSVEGRFVDMETDNQPITAAIDDDSVINTEIPSSTEMDAAAMEIENAMNSILDSDSAPPTYEIATTMQVEPPEGIVFECIHCGMFNVLCTL